MKIFGRIFNLLGAGILIALAIQIPHIRFAMSQSSLTPEAGVRILLYVAGGIALVVIGNVWMKDEDITATEMPIREKIRVEVARVRPEEKVSAAVPSKPESRAYRFWGWFKIGVGCLLLLLLLAVAVYLVLHDSLNDGIVFLLVPAALACIFYVFVGIGILNWQPGAIFLSLVLDTLIVLGGLVVGYHVLSWTLIPLKVLVLAVVILALVHAGSWMTLMRNSANAPRHYFASIAGCLLFVGLLWTFQIVKWNSWGVNFRKHVCDPMPSSVRVLDYHYYGGWGPNHSIAFEFNVSPADFSLIEQKYKRVPCSDAGLHMVRPYEKQHGNVKLVDWQCYEQASGEIYLIYSPTAQHAFYDWTDV